MFLKNYFPFYRNKNFNKVFFFLILKQKGWKFLNLEFCILSKAVNNLFNAYKNFVEKILIKQKQK